MHHHEVIPVAVVHRAVLDDAVPLVPVGGGVVTGHHFALVDAEFGGVKGRLDAQLILKGGQDRFPFGVGGRDLHPDFVEEVLADCEAVVGIGVFRVHARPDAPHAVEFPRVRIRRFAEVVVVGQPREVVWRIVQVFRDVNKVPVLNRFVLTGPVGIGGLVGIAVHHVRHRVGGEQQLESFAFRTGRRDDEVDVDVGQLFIPFKEVGVVEVRQFRHAAGVGIPVGQRHRLFGQGVGLLVRFPVDDIRGEPGGCAAAFFSAAFRFGRSGAAALGPGRRAGASAVAGGKGAGCDHAGEQQGQEFACLHKITSSKRCASRAQTVALFFGF